MTTATGFTIPRAFFRALPRGRIHRARIIALRLAAAIRARHFVRVHFHQLFKTLSASGTFILQKRHTCHPTTKLPFYYTRKNAFWQVSKILPKVIIIKIKHESKIFFLMIFAHLFLMGRRCIVYLI